MTIDTKPLVLVAHPRSRSSAFERVFIQNKNHVNTLHEPFGDAYWVGPERQLGRYDKLRSVSGFDDATYKKVTEKIGDCLEASEAEHKRLFIKEMAFFLFPAPGSASSLAPSFGPLPLEPRNPTLLPRAELAKFQFTFLIRHPYLAVPSYYRLSLPGEKESSCVSSFTTEDLGYSELRRLFDYLREEGLLGESSSSNGVANGHANGYANGHTNGHHGVETGPFVVIDSEELICRPHEIMSSYCKLHNVPYDPSILRWDRTEDQERAAAVIDRWGFPVTFHRAVLSSDGLGSVRSTAGQEKKSRDARDFENACYAKWVQEFGEDGARRIRTDADAQMPDYMYLRRFLFTGE